VTIRSLALLCSVLLLCLASAIVEAQDLGLNNPISGDLASGGSLSFAFTAREGQMLSFLVRADAELDPILSIENNNGDSLISNDDYDYPNSRNALIEGFYAPYNGSYSLVLSAYGSTAGEYELTMFSGYSDLNYLTHFDEAGDWAGLSVPDNEAATFNVVNGTANLNQAGIQQVGIASGLSPESERYYLNSRISSITGNRGWEVGLVFKLQDASNYYRLLINNSGAWQLAKIQAGTEIPLRDWNTHPAIRPEATNFALAVLVNGNGYDVFYDDSYIGSAYDDALQGGQLGFVVVTSNVVGSDVTARYDSLTVTSPTLLDDAPIFPNQLVAASTNGTIRELERRLLIPNGGEMAFTIPESFAQNNRAGVSVFPMGNESVFTNFVLGATVSWSAAPTDSNACGIAFRNDGANNYVLAYVDNIGGYGLSERADTSFIQNLYNNRIESQVPPYQLLLIVNGTEVNYFINGTYAMTMSLDRTEGTVGEAVVNFEAVNTNCQFNNFWLWRW
jgi:hypothetical protein